MAISLQKNQSVVDLVKKNPGLKTVLVGLGWDPVTAKQTEGKKGLLGGLFGGTSQPVSSQNFDVDASALLFNEKNQLVEKVYYGNKKNSNGAIKHSGDNLTGDGDGDDESILVDLSNIPANVEKVVFVVNIYQGKSRGQDFGMIENAYIRLVNNSSNQELVRYNLTDGYSGKLSIFVGQVARENGDWSFKALGEGGTEGSIDEMVRNYPRLGF